MLTIRCQTSHFIEHSGNVVDLNEFRQRLTRAQYDSLARKSEELGFSEELEASEEPGFRPVVLTMTRRERRRARRERQAWRLDACASLTVIFMTLLFALRVML